MALSFRAPNYGVKGERLFGGFGMAGVVVVALMSPAVVLVDRLLLCHYHQHITCRFELCVLQTKKGVDMLL